METKWIFSARFVDTALERPRWRFTGNYRVLRTLQLGVEYNAVAEEIGPLVTWYVLTESHARPALFLGTSSDRIGSPPGTQSYYLTLAKHISRTPLAPYVSLNYSEWDEGFNFPFGANITLPANFSLRPMYDGKRSHLMLTHYYRQASVSAMYVWFERVGVAASVGF